VTLVTASAIRYPLLS